MKTTHIPNPVPIGNNPKWISVFFILPNGEAGQMQAHCVECLNDIIPICGVWAFPEQTFPVWFPTKSINPPMDGVYDDPFEWVEKQIKGELLKSVEPAQQ